MCTVHLQGKGGKGHSKRKAPDELWTDGTIPERRNPLINFLADKLPKEFIQVPVPAASPSYELFFFAGKKGEETLLLLVVCDTRSNKPKSISCFKIEIPSSLTNPIRRWPKIALKLCQLIENLKI